LVPRGLRKKPTSDVVFVSELLKDGMYSHDLGCWARK
jgi:hypothetical protein